jgi:hypothetical protein
MSGWFEDGQGLTKDVMTVADSDSLRETDWHRLLSQEFEKPYWAKLENFVQQERDRYNVYLSGSRQGSRDCWMNPWCIRSRCFHLLDSSKGLLYRDMWLNRIYLLRKTAWFLPCP